MLLLGLPRIGQQPIHIGIRDVHASEHFLVLLGRRTRSSNLSPNEQIKKRQLGQQMLCAIFVGFGFQFLHPETVNVTVFVSLPSMVAFTGTVPATSVPGTFTENCAPNGCGPTFTVAAPKLTTMFLPLSPVPTKLTVSPANA